MNEPSARPPASVPVSRVMLHDLVNHLTIALGNSDLLLMELAPGAPSHVEITEIRDACRRAVALVDQWRQGFSPEE
jgi:hypothetical protein